MRPRSIFSANLPLIELFFILQLKNKDIISPRFLLCLILERTVISWYNDVQRGATQMAHHGQNGVSREFYEYIKPQRCIWATPEWLWNNDGGKGFDTHKFQTVRTRE